MLPRGIRNNNPLNIRQSNCKWVGLAKVQNDKQFCQFEAMEWGWRAAFVLLCRTYYALYHFYTIRSIVQRWAPRNDHNDTDAYIAHVCRLTGLDPDEALGIPKKQPACWMMVGLAMAMIENGTSSLDIFAMLKGWERCWE